MLTSLLRKKGSFIIALCFLAPLFTKAADTTTVVVNDTTLATVYYHQVNFATPTRLVFPNLRYVNGYIYFHQNVNLVGVEFPVLDSCGSYFYFAQNLALKKITAPNLTSVWEYLYVYGNSSLVQLDVCNLQQVISAYNDPGMPEILPYYNVTNNTPAVDQTPLCFAVGHTAPQNLQLSNDTVSENLPSNTFVGTLSVTSNPADSIHYILSYSIPGGDNEAFRVQGNQLFTAATFNYEVKSTYNLQIIAYNQLGQSTNFSVTVNVSDVTGEDTTTIVINDTVLSSVYYHQYNFATPTKLQFPNLKYVTGYVYFHQNINLVSVEMPMLDSCGSYFYFAQNLALKKITAPNLTSVWEYLYVQGNTSLVQLDVCNLQQILPGYIGIPEVPPYYYITGNTPSVDQIPLCFAAGHGAPQNLQLSDNSISENLPPNTLVGTLSVTTSNPADSVRYYIPYMPGSDGASFTIQGNKLYSATTFDYENKSQYNFQIGTFNQLGEKASFDVTVNVNNIASEDTVTVEITDTILPSVYYHQVSFTNPTKLIFRNLRSVNGYVYFHQNVNLAGVEFPVLDSCGDYFYFHQNTSMVQLIAPALRTIGDYAYINGNTALQLLDICDLVRIRPVNIEQPYYFIRNNGNVDFAAGCFRTTNIIFVPETNIIIQPAPYTYIGHFIPDVDTAFNRIRYFFTDSTGAEITNNDFVIRGDSVFLAREYNTYTDTTFYFSVGAIRSAITVRRSLDQSPGLSEKISMKVRMGFGNNQQPTLNKWIGAGISPATSAWENPANWTMNVVPDAYSNVEINSGNIVIGTNVICRSLAVKTGTNITVKTGCKVTVTH